jgi:hypothetical protein
MSVSTTTWPEITDTPGGYVNAGNGSPFGVIHLLGLGGDSTIQFLKSVPRADQAGYLRALAEVATRIADELDPPTEVPA